jgi:DNA polymerase elongation subunit (family B)
MNEFMNKIIGGNSDHVIAIDTDSLYVDFEPLVKKLGLESKPKAEVVALIDKMCQEQFEPMLEKSYEDLASYMDAYENKMVMAREAIADAGIWTAKKRYILNVHNNEGVQYAKPKLKIMGIEAVKSSTPMSCREALKELFKVIVSGSEADVQNAIQAFKAHFSTLPPEAVSFPRGVSKVSEWKDREKVYKKGTPIHVRGSLLYNKQIEDLGLRNYQTIKDGEKIKFCYLKMPNPIKENVIAFPDYLPQELKLHKYIDYDLQFEKAFLEVVRPILAAIGWQEEETVSVEDFFV